MLEKSIMPEQLNPGLKSNEKKEKVENLKESISKKIEYISRMRGEIDSPEVTGMSIDEFDTWSAGERENIFTVFPEQKIIIERILFLNTEIKKLSIEIGDLDAKKESIIYTAIQRYLKDDPNTLEQYFSEELDSQEEVDLEEEALTPEEQEEINVLDEQKNTLDKQRDEYLGERDSLLEKEDTLFVFTAYNFFQKIKEKKEEVANIKGSFEKGSFEKGPLNDFLKYDYRLVNFIKEKGTDINIKFDTYDVVIYLSKEDAQKFFMKNNPGWHFSNTPISCVVTSRRTEEENTYTEIHEKGHNKSECLRDAGVHNTIYHEQTVRFLKGDIERYQSFKKLKSANFITDGLLSSIIKKIRSQIQYLNGEISADIENLVNGNFSGFYFHFLNTAEGLYKLIRSSVSLKEDKELDSLLKRELNNLVTKAAEHVKNALFLSMVARKYHKENEFFAATLMSPQNMRLAERYLKDELGDTFEFEKSFSTLAPEYVLPEKLHNRVYKVHTDGMGRFISSIFSENATRGIVPPRDYVTNKNEKSVRRYENFYIFDQEFTKLFEVSGIFNPIELKRFVAFATPERMSQLDEDQKKQAIYTLEDAVEGNLFMNKIFNTFFDIHKPEEIVEYVQNIQKLFKIFEKQEQGEIFAQEIFETCFYKAFRLCLPEDNSEILKKFMESWNGIEFKLEKYISDDGNTYDKSWSVEDLLKESKTENKLKDNIINNPQSTRVFQYIKSITDNNGL